MSAKNHGGSAYPMVLGDTPISAGMTLRDYFAAKAMAAYLTSDHAPRKPMQEDFAIASYAMADAMLAERAK